MADQLKTISDPAKFLQESRKLKTISDPAKFLQESRKEYEEDALADKLDRERAIAANEFANSSEESLSQWRPDALKDRTENGLPSYQLNRIPIYLQHVNNAGRQNKPSIELVPDDNGLPETAEFFGKRIRYIEQRSKADIAYDTAREQQTAAGRAFSRVTTEYIPGTTKLRQIVKPIADFSCVIPGPHKEIDYSDASRWWVRTSIRLDAYKLEYPNSVVSSADWATPEGTEGWFNLGPNSDEVQLLEKFYKKDGKAYWALMNGAEVLKDEECLSDDLDIVPLWGRQTVVKGVQYNYALHENAKTWQRLVNLYASNIVHELSKQSKSRMRAPIGSIPPNFLKAIGANQALDVAFYQQYDDQSRPLNPPELISEEPAIQAMRVGLLDAIEGIKASMGMYDASMGARSNETSGIAIERRKVQGEVVNFHFPDNEERYRQRIGEILLKRECLLIENGTSVPVLNERGEVELVPVGSDIPGKGGKSIRHKMNAAAYGVRVKSGPTWDSQRDQQSEYDQELIRANPELMFTGVGVAMLRNREHPNSKEAVEGLERYIELKTPGLLPPKEEEGKPPIPPEVQQQLIGLQQELETTKAFAQEQFEKAQGKQAEIDSKERMHAADLAFKREELHKKSHIEMAKLASAEDRLLLEKELGHAETAQTLEHESEEARATREHQSGEAEAARTHESTEADVNRQHTSEQAEAARKHEAQQAAQAAAVAE